MPAPLARDLSDKAVGARIRKVRAFFGVSQAEFARQLGITRERLASYESARAPLPLGLALHLCRHFVVSEHWLATGRAWRVAESREAAKQGDCFSEVIQEFGAFSSRRCVSLALDERAAGANQRQRFTAAFMQGLVSSYPALAWQGGIYPRVTILPDDPPELIRNTFSALSDLWLERLTGPRKRAFVHLLARYGMALRDAAEPIEEEARNRGAKDVDTFDHVRHELTTAMLSEVPSSWDDLRECLTEATAEHGAKARLAAEFGVTRQSVNGWLSGKTAPTAETALALLHWVLEMEQQPKKSPGRVDARTRQRPKKSKLNEKKPSSGPP